MSAQHSKRIMQACESMASKVLNNLARSVLLIRVQLSSGRCCNMKPTLKLHPKRNLLHEVSLQGHHFVTCVILIGGCLLVAIRQLHCQVVGTRGNISKVKTSCPCSCFDCPDWGTCSTINAPIGAWLEEVYSELGCEPSSSCSDNAVTIRVIQNGALNTTCKQNSRQLWVLTGCGCNRDSAETRSF